MRLTYVGDVKPGEIDILTQNQHYPLVIRSLEGEKIICRPHLKRDGHMRRFRLFSRIALKMAQMPI